MEWWNEFTRIVEEFWNKPVPIIGFTVGACILGALWIISKTSIGKKALKELRAKYEEIKNVNDAIKKIADDLLEAKDNVIAEMKKEYEAKLAIAQEEVRQTKQLVIAIASNINNVKIKKLIEEFEKLPEPQNVSDYIIQVKEQYESEYKQKYELVLKRLEELENGKNSNTIKEEI